MSDATDELSVLIGPGQGEPEQLVLISVPDAAGMVTTRSWSAADWSAAPVSTKVSADMLFQRLESASKHSRTLNQSITQIRLWLHQ